MDETTLDEEERITLPLTHEERRYLKGRRNEAQRVRLSHQGSSYVLSNGPRPSHWPEPRDPAEVLAETEEVTA